VRRLLTYDPQQRITAKEALSSTWVRQSEQISVPSAELRASLQRLEKFHTQMHFQKAVLTYFATQSLHPIEEARLRRLFDIFDEDKDGTISMPELVNGYYKVYHDMTRAKLEAKKIMHRVDLNKNGSIDYTEFLVANLQIASMFQEARLKEAFDFYDSVCAVLASSTQDKNGQISLDELRQVFGTVCDEATLKRMIQEGDLDNDGQVRGIYDLYRYPLTSSRR
jgi:calcium-dependent protein kinase